MDRFKYKQIRLYRIPYRREQASLELIRPLLNKELASFTEHIDGDATLPPYEISTYGKPSLPGEPIHFNISHSGDWLLLAVGDRPLGIDIEKIDERRSFIAIAVRFFSSAEQEWIGEDASRFFRLWCRHEAYAKACGGGIFRDKLSPQTALSVNANPIQVADESWWMQDIDAPSGYRAALCAGRSDYQLETVRDSSS